MDKTVLRKILKKLYIAYVAEQKASHFPAAQVFRENNIPDGADLTSLRNNGFLKIDSGENIYLTAEGISYMGRVLDWYGKLAGLTKNGEMVNGDKVERAFDGVDKQIESEQIPRSAVFNVRGSQLHFGQGDNVGRNKPFQKKFTSKDIPYWLKYLVAIITILGFILPLIVYYYPNNEPLSQTDQNENDGGGEITTNHKVDYIDNKGYKKNLFEGNIYKLPSQADQLSTTIEKNNYFKKFEGLWVENTGFITDIYEPGLNNFGDIAGLYYQVRIDETEGSKSPYIMCVFDESWGKKLETIIIPFKVQFSGAIDNVQTNTRTWLIKCVLK